MLFEEVITKSDGPISDFVVGGFIFPLKLPDPMDNQYSCVHRLGIVQGFYGFRIHVLANKLNTLPTLIPLVRYLREYCIPSYTPSS
jgi:hypothetical protein